MPIDTVAMFLKVLQSSGLLEPAQSKELVSLQNGFKDPKLLARELMKRGWLTPFQVNQLFQGREKELLLGQYVLLERLGEGGMGTVFKAKHRRLDRIDAIKVIRKDHLANAAAVQRFHQEAKAAARVSHTNIVSVYDANEAGGSHFLSMEFVEGLDLAKMVKQLGPLPIEQACAYIRQAAQGLQHAHERGLVHRDIKPSNLFVNITEGTVKVLDMGLARLRSAAQEKTSELTQTGAVMGTPDYISPEQAMDSHQVDIRADIYSLGCSLYFLLTGKPPFPGGDLMQKLLKHQLEQPQAVEQLRPDVPPGLVLVIRKMMAKKPEERHQTPQEVAKALEPFLTGGADTFPMAIPMSDDSMIRLGLWKQMGWRRRLRYALRTPQRRLIAGIGAGAVVTLLLMLVGLGAWSALSQKEVQTVQPVEEDKPKPPPVAAVDNRPPLDRLDNAKIPPEEKFAWQPRERIEVVGVIGNHRWRHGRAVQSVAVSPDGKIVASGGDDSTIRIWDINSGIEKAFGWHGGVRGLAFSPDGKTLVSCGTDGHTRAWDTSNLSNFKEKTAILGHDRGAYAVAYSPDGKGVAVGGWFWEQPKEGNGYHVGVVKLLDTTTWKEKYSLRGDSQVNIVGVAFSSDSQLVIGGRRVWEVSTGKEVGQIPLGHQDRQPQAVAVIGRTVAVSYDDGRIRYWNGAFFPATERNTIGVSSLAFSPDGRFLVTGSTDGYIKCWSAGSNEPQGSFRGRLDRVNSLAFTPDGTTLVSGSNDGVIRLWDMKDRNEKTHGAARYGLGPFSPDGETLFLYGGNTIVQWDLATMKERRKFTGNEGYEAIALSRDGKTLAATSSGARVVRLWNVADGKELAALKHEGIPTAATFSSDGKTLATTANFPPPNDKTPPLCHIQTWDVATGVNQSTLKKPLENRGGRTLAYAPNSPLLVWGGWDFLALWDGKAEQASILEPKNWDVGTVAWAPNGGRFAAGGRFNPDYPHGWVKVFNANGSVWKNLQQPGGLIAAHGERVNTLAFSPDIRYLATGSDDGLLILWDMNDGNMLDKWQMHGPVRRIYFAPDSRHLAVQNSEDVVYIMRLSR